MSEKFPFKMEILHLFQIQFYRHVTYSLLDIDMRVLRNTQVNTLRYNLSV